METPGPASVPPHPIEHPQRAGMDRQHRAVAGHRHPASVDRRRLEAIREDCRAGTDVGLGANRHGRRLVAGDKVAATGVVLSGRRLAAVRSKIGAGIGARAARLGSDCRVNVRPMAAAVRRCVDHSRRVNGGDARSQRPQGTTIQPGTTMEPASLRSTDRAQTHPEGEPQARIGSSQGHRNPPSPCRGRALKKTRSPTISCLEWASRPPHGTATSG